jgi:hypothetical protein
MRRTILPGQWKSIRSVRLSIRFHTFNSYKLPSLRIRYSGDPVKPQYCDHWKDICRDVLSMTGLQRFVLGIEMIGSYAEDYNWHEIFNHLKPLQVKKWDVETLGFEKHFVALKNWIAANGVKCRVLEKNDIEEDWDDDMCMDGFD